MKLQFTVLVAQEVMLFRNSSKFKRTFDSGKGSTLKGEHVGNKMEFDGNVLVDLNLNGALNGSTRRMRANMRTTQNRYTLLWGKVELFKEVSLNCYISSCDNYL